MKVTVYSTSTCGICHALMKWLDNKGVKYREVIIDENDADMQELLQVSDGAIGVPFTVIETDNKRTIKIAGFNQSHFTEALA